MLATLLEQIRHEAMHSMAQLYTGPDIVQTISLQLKSIEGETYK